MLRKVLETIEKWCSENKSKINYKKSEIVLIRNDERDYPKDTSILGL